eukprot:138401_1
MYLCQIYLSMMYTMKILSAVSPFQLRTPTIPKYLWAHQLAFNNQTSTVYLFGGVESEVIWSNDIFKLDLSNTTARWITLNVNTTTAAFYSEVKASVTIDKTAYFMGITDETDVANLSAFDLNTERFTTSLIMPLQTVQGCVVANNTHIFMVGGFYVSAPSNFSNRIQIFDIESCVWSFVVIPFSSCRTACAMTHDNIIYVFGGQIHSSAPGVTNTIYKYNTLTREWRCIGNMTSKIWSGYAFHSKSDNNIYIRGDRIMVFDVEKETIIAEHNLTMQVHSSPMLIYNNSLINFGGVYNINPIQSTAWLQIADIPLKNPYSDTCSEDNIISNFGVIILIIISLLMAFVAVTCCYVNYRRRANDNVNNLRAVNLQHDNEEPHANRSYQSIQSPNGRIM